MDLLSQQLETDYMDLLQAQDRFFLRALVASKKNEITEKSTSLTTDLQDYQEEIKMFTTTTLARGLDQGLVGMAADAANSYLASRPEPDLHNPLG